jgi:hypothetical protein
MARDAFEGELPRGFPRYFRNAQERTETARDVWERGGENGRDLTIWSMARCACSSNSRKRAQCLVAAGSAGLAEAWRHREGIGAANFSGRCGAETFLASDQTFDRLPRITAVEAVHLRPLNSFKPRPKSELRIRGRPPKLAGGG